MKSIEKKASNALVALLQRKQHKNQLPLARRLINELYEYGATKWYKRKKAKLIAAIRAANDHMIELSMEGTTCTLTEGITPRPSNFYLKNTEEGSTDEGNINQTTTRMGNTERGEERGKSDLENQSSGADTDTRIKDV